MRVRREEGSKLSRLRPGSGLAWYAGLASITIRIRLSYDMNTLFNFLRGGLTVSLVINMYIFSLPSSGIGT